MSSIQRWKWHRWARVIALLLLAEQWWDLSSAIPSSEGIVIACIGAFFAPVAVSER